MPYNADKYSIRIQSDVYRNKMQGIQRRMDRPTAHIQMPLLST